MCSSSLDAVTIYERSRRHSLISISSILNLLTSNPHLEPFSDMVLNSTSSIPLTPKNKKERDDVVRILYEEYISLEPVMEVWETPMTSRPSLEPTFAAGFHGIELAFVLMAEFISDPRHYVVKRPRIELIADDITRQMELVSPCGPTSPFFPFFHSDP